MVGVIRRGYADSAAGYLTLWAWDPAGAHIADLRVGTHYAAHAAVLAVQLWVDAETVAAFFAVALAGVGFVTSAATDIIAAELPIGTLLIRGTFDAGASFDVAPGHACHTRAIGVAAAAWGTVLLGRTVLPGFAI